MMYKITVMVQKPWQLGIDVDTFAYKPTQFDYITSAENEDIAIKKVIDGLDLSGVEVMGTSWETADDIVLVSIKE